jgi:hypothetical protein
MGLPDPIRSQKDLQGGARRRSAVGGRRSAVGGWRVPTATPSYQSELIR